MARPTPPDKKPHRLPIVTGTVVLELADQPKLEQRVRAAGLETLWPGTRVEVEVSGCTPWDVHPDAVTFMVHAAVTRSLHLEFRGDRQAVGTWTQMIGDRVVEQLTGTPR